MAKKLVAALLLAACVGAVAGVPMKLKILDNTATTGAICLDGTPGGYYYAPGSGAGASKWVLFFQGGGWCYNEYDCWGRSKTALGSSKSWGPTMDIGGIMSDDCNSNPTFCTWNRVNMNYCDGNSFSGSRADPIVVNGDRVYFRGHQIVLAILQELALTRNLGAASEVLLSGCSAGGLSTYLHADLVGSVMYRLAPGLQKYGAAPVSGFFMLHDNVEGKPVYPDQIRYIFTLSNASAGLNQDCIANHDAQDQWKCNFAQPSYSFTKSRLFILDSALDSWQTGCIATSEPVANPQSTANGNCSAAPGWAPCAQNVENCDADHIAAMISYEQDFLAAVKTTPTFFAPGNGAFIYSCHTHCAAVGGLWNSVLIQGVSMQQAVAAWWADGPSAPASQHSYLPCIYHGGDTRPRRCNPTCPLS